MLTPRATGAGEAPWKAQPRPQWLLLLPNYLQVAAGTALALEAMIVAVVAVVVQMVIQDKRARQCVLHADPLAERAPL